MMTNQRHRFASLPAGPGHVVRRWPAGLGAMQLVGFSRPCRRHDLAAICAWAGLSVARRGRAGVRVPASAIARLVKKAARAESGNHYHHPGHYAHVVMAAGVLAEAAGLACEERALLILAALVHDLGHHGRRSSKRLYAQERWSSALVRQVLGAAGADMRLAGRVERLLLATAINKDALRLTILKADPLARLLADADIFASIFYSRDLALRMTRMLKLEQRLPGAPETLLSHFSALIEAEGLRSATGRRLYARLAMTRRPAQNTVNHEGWDELSDLL